MKNLFCLFSVVLLFSFTACNNDDDTNKEWRAKNSITYEKIVANEEWTLIDSPPGVGEGVYYKEVKKGAGIENPLQTTSVKVLYKGYYYNDEKEDIFEVGTTAVKCKSVSELPEEGEVNVLYLLWKGINYTTYIWLTGDKTFQQVNYDFAATFLLNDPSLLRGFNIAIQNMVIGDKWEICIPYFLGYGSSGLVQSGVTIIPGYSTLFFEVELLEIDQYPK